MKTFRAAGLACIVAVIAAFGSGCAADSTRGYSSATTFPQGISSVAVPVFSNATFVREVEFLLTDALIKEIESRTPYKVTSESVANTIVLGHVKDVQLDMLSKSRLTGLSEEVIVSVSIDFQWKDLRTGRVLVERKGFTGAGLFVPSQPTSQPIEIGRHSAVQILARDVVEQLRSDW